MKVKFQAEDGLLFDTQKECENYDKIPTVWVVSEDDKYNLLTVVRGVFLSKEYADDYIKNNENCHKESFKLQG